MAETKRSGVEMVTVSLLHPMGYRETKDGPITRYPRGLVQMPLAHAKAMGVLHRVRTVKTEPDGSQVVSALPFDGAFDDKLAATLIGAGYKTLDELSQASQSELMAIEGIGPAAYVRIRNATKKEME